MNAHTSLHSFDSATAWAAMFDSDGFLLDSEVWSRELATMIAEEEGVEHLTMNHWRIINFVRKRSQEFSSPPVMRIVCRATGLQKSQVRSLFGDCRAMWRISGLPNPGVEAMAYMS